MVYTVHCALINTVESIYTSITLTRSTRHSALHIPGMDVQCNIRILLLNLRMYI
jgi:hypothetical protein